MADWRTISALATAGGTLVLAGATFAAVRSAHQSARVTERALLASIRPVLVPSRLQDPPEKVGGLAVLDRWDFLADNISESPHRDPGDFRRLTRDLYIPGGDLGFWQGALRDPDESTFAVVRDAVDAHRRVAIDLLYGDHEGGQRTITRFVLLHREDGQWLTAVSRHWNLDRSDPR